MGNEGCVFHCLNKASGFSAAFKINSTTGLTLVELILVVAIIGTLCGIAVPAYSGHMKKVETKKGVSDILNIELAIEKYYAENGHYPDSLAEIGKDGLRDPWDRPYQYVRPPEKKLGEIHPVNKDYDLWSNGHDGKTNLKALTTNTCKDDILRAFDGAYIGLVEDLR